jgi:hypothetical protein
MLQFPIYLDHNATTPCDPRVVEAMIPYFTNNFGNAASRNHSFGWQAEEAVDYAREQVAKLIGADPKVITWPSKACMKCMPAKATISSPAISSIKLFSIPANTSKKRVGK